LLSLSKLPVPLETAQALFTRHLSGEARIHAYQELTDGMYNAAYRVDLADGMTCVLKVAPPPEVRVLRYEREILRAEVEVLRLAAARTAMPVPKVLFHAESSDLLPSPCFAMDFVPGESLHKLRPSLPTAEQERIDRECAAFLRQLNAIQGPDFGLFTPSAPRFPTWRAAFDQLLKDILLDGEEAQVSLPLPTQALLELARRHYAVLDEVTQPCLVHWDLWDGNIFIDPATLQISGMIDFERALWADLLMEVNFGPLGINPAFFAGYGLILPFSPSQRTRRLLYDLYLFLIMVIECSYRRYPTDDQEKWVRPMLEETIKKLEVGEDQRTIP
jgi:aminoglycoside phosphotransferase (APT) family kinase protein